jgi:hypothetical protein
MTAHDEWDEDESRVNQRLSILIESGKLEAQGDIRKWRFSEVRQPST